MHAVEEVFVAFRDGDLPRHDVVPGGGVGGDEVDVRPHAVSADLEAALLSEMEKLVRVTHTNAVTCGRGVRGDGHGGRSAAFVHRQGEPVGHAEADALGLLLEHAGQGEGECRACGHLPRQVEVDVGLFDDADGAAIGLPADGAGHRLDARLVPDDVPARSRGGSCGAGPVPRGRGAQGGVVRDGDGAPFAGFGRHPHCGRSLDRKGEHVGESGARSPRVDGLHGELVRGAGLEAREGYQQGRRLAEVARVRLGGNGFRAAAGQGREDVGPGARSARAAQADVVAQRLGPALGVGRGCPVQPYALVGRHGTDGGGHSRRRVQHARAQHRPLEVRASVAVYVGLIGRPRSISHLRRAERMGQRRGVVGLRAERAVGLRVVEVAAAVDQLGAPVVVKVEEDGPEELHGPRVGRAEVLGGVVEAHHTLRVAPDAGVEPPVAVEVGEVDLRVVQFSREGDALKGQVAPVAQDADAVAVAAVEVDVAVAVVIARGHQVEILTWQRVAAEAVIAEVEVDVSARVVSLAEVGAPVVVEVEQDVGGAVRAAQTLVADKLPVAVVDEHVGRGHGEVEPACVQESRVVRPVLADLPPEIRKSVHVEIDGQSGHIIYVGVEQRGVTGERAPPVAHVDALVVRLGPPVGVEVGEGHRVAVGRAGAVRRHLHVAPGRRRAGCPCGCDGQAVAAGCGEDDVGCMSVAGDDFAAVDVESIGAFLSRTVGERRVQRVARREGHPVERQAEGGAAEVVGGRFRPLAAAPERVDGLHGDAVGAGGPASGVQPGRAVVPLIAVAESIAASVGIGAAGDDRAVGPLDAQGIGEVGRPGPVGLSRCPLQAEAAVGLVGNEPGRAGCLRGGWKGDVVETPHLPVAVVDAFEHAVAVEVGKITPVEEWGRQRGGRDIPGVVPSEEDAVRIACIAFRVGHDTPAVAEAVKVDEVILVLEEAFDRSEAAPAVADEEDKI